MRGCSAWSNPSDPTIYITPSLAISLRDGSYMRERHFGEEVVILRPEMMTGTVSSGI